MECDANGTRSRAGDRRDFIGVHAGDAAEEDDLPMGGGETAERAREPLEQLAGFHAVLGPFRSFDLCRLVFPRDPVAPVVIDHQMPGDGEEPRAELAGGLIHATALVASLGHWQQAALVGVVAFVLSVLLSLVVPYHTMVAVCRDIVPKVLPTPGSYLIAGLLYGLLPLTIGSALQGRLAGPQTVLGAVEATLIFGAVLAPYVVLRCGEFPHSLLVGFVGGIALGGLAGALAGTWLTRRIVRMEVPA